MDTSSPTLDEAPAAPPVPTRRPRQYPEVRRALFLLAVLGIAAVTAALRLYHQATSYELFMDEIQYADVANAIASGHGPRLFGDPFFLHPPLFFSYLATLQGAPVPYMTVDHVLALRPFVVVFGVLNSVLVVAIARRLTSRRCALVAGVIYALDPFIVRFDSRVMLEAPTLTATLAGLALGLVAVGSTGRRRTALLVLAGLAFGVAVTTKSTSAMVTTLPLVLMGLASSGPRRRAAFGMIAVQCGFYGCYVVWVAATGNFGPWFTQTLGGVVRATAKPVTGFNSANSPSLIDRILAQLTQFGPSYLLIAVAVVATAVLVFEEVRSRGHVGRHEVRGGDAPVLLLTCWLAGVLLSIGYTAAFGELEEQTFYLMAVPSTIGVAVLMARAHKELSRLVLWGVVTVVLLWSGQVWNTVHNRLDNGYQQLVTHMAPLAGSGAVIALGEYTAQFVMPGFRIVALAGATPPAGAQFAVVSTELTRLHLAPVTDDDIASLDRHYPLAFVAKGRTVGELRLYDLTRPLKPGS